MKNKIYLESVGAVLIDGVVYPATQDGGYDDECGVPLNECVEEWYDALSPTDLKIVMK